MPPKDQLNESMDFNGWMSRAARAVPSSLKKEGKSTIVEAVITTEQAALVVDWERWEVVREILLMDGVEMPETKQVPLLNTHSRWSTSDVRGSIRNLRTEGEKLIGDVHFWSKAEDEISQVEEGHLTDLSAGYRTYKEHTVEIFPKQEAEVNGRVFKNDFNDNYRLLIRTKWSLKEGSLVPIGADTAAKFRSDAQPRMTSADPELQKKLDDLTKEKEKLESEKQELTIKLNERTNPMPETKTPDQIRKEERERTSAIETIAKRFEKTFKGGKSALDKAVKEAVENETSVDQFRAIVFDNLDESKPVEQSRATELGLSDNEINKFSISRAIMAEAETRGGDVNAYVKHKAEFEKEVMGAAAVKAMQETGVKAHGIILPFDVMKKQMLANQNGQRTLAVGTPSAGGYLVEDTQLADMFIPLLRNKTAAGQLGVKILSGLKGNIEVPKQLTAGTFAWGAENWNVTDSDLTLGQVTASPKEGKSSTTYGRRLLLQSNPGIDQLVNEDLLNIARIGLDLAVFQGAGGNAPTGVLNTSGIGDVVGASIDWDAILEFESDIAIANADVNTLKFAMNPATRAVLKGRLKAAGVSGYLMDDNGNVNGYGSVVSNQMPNGGLTFGDWSRVWLCDWSLFDLLVNPYKDNSGNITVVVFVYADVVTSIAAALSHADDVN